MTPERWQQIKELVNSVLEQNDEDRASVLHQSCADDPAMIPGVEALLSFHEQATHNLSPASALLNERHEFSPERWELIEKIFNSAMGRDPEDQREYLAQACGTDEALRREIEALLVFQTGVSGVIHEAIQDAAGSIVEDKSSQSRFAPGMILNKRYRIVGLLGGEVYRADDLKLGHPVALKFITGTLTDKTALA